RAGPPPPDRRPETPGPARARPRRTTSPRGAAVPSTSRPPPAPAPPAPRSRTAPDRAARRRRAAGRRGSPAWLRAGRWFGSWALPPRLDADGLLAWVDVVREDDVAGLLDAQPVRAHGGAEGPARVGEAVVEVERGARGQTFHLHG